MRWRCRSRRADRSKFCVESGGASSHGAKPATPNCRGERKSVLSAAHKDAVLSPPVYLEPGVLKFLQARAQARGMTLNMLVNQLLKKDIELIEAAG